MRGRRTTVPGIELTSGTLATHGCRVTVPGYDRRALRPGVVHLGVGHFHRSHQAVYLDELAQRGISLDWGLAGVGLRSRAVQAALAPQDGLYTVVQRSADRDTARVVGALVGLRHAPDDPAAAVALLAASTTRLVTLTITAGAYAADPATGACRHDALALLVAALDARRRAGRRPFTVLSCDNMAANGAVTRAAVLARAERRDARLARWIGAHVAFPSSMVDRITPKTSDEDRRLVAERFGIADRWPVMTEPFSQWIVEDAFSDGRPPLEEVGVRFVADVRPYALTKTRLLNAVHCALGFLGSLAGHRHTDEAMADPVFARYTRRLMEDEIVPLLPPVLGIRQPDYARAMQARLANPGTRDQLSRLCRNGSAKLPLHILPSIAAAHEAGRDHPLLTLAVAGWVRFLGGVDEHGRALAVDDPIAERSTGGARLLAARRTALAALREHPGFAAELERAASAVEREGVRAALAGRLAVPPRLAA